jgi:glycosyltransferase involved in cell wall biosynthesis
MIFARRQAESLRAEGTDVDCFFLRSRTGPAAVLSEFLRFRSVLKDFQPDVIHSHYGTVTALFCAIGAGRAPFVITFRGSDLNRVPGSGIRGRAGRLFSQIAALRAQSIICVSAQLRDRLWWRKEAVVVMPSGVDAHVFRPLGRLAARLALGWPPEDRVIVFNAGRDPRTKREDLALESVEEAQKDFPGLRLEVLRGATDPALMPTILSAADCLLVTSDSEGSPTVVQEALACTLPIVSVDVGDIRQRLEGVDNARVVERDPRALASAMLELTRVPLRTNGRDKVPEISLHSIARELQGLYGQMARV